MIKKILVAAIALSISQQTLAFGRNGHRIVSHIAEQNLTETAKVNIKKLIKGVPLAKLSTWADSIRSQEQWKHTGPWHYISVADDEHVKDVKHTHKGDVIEKLEEMEKQMLNPKSSEQERWQALAFYVHFVADVHQPMHVGRKDDHGGNKVKLSWFGNYTNLHRVWDTDIIKDQAMSYTEYADFLDDVDQQQVELWQKSDHLDWAEESKAMREFTYDLPKSGKLEYKFTFKNIPRVNKRLAQAGYRLAAKLNKIFGEK